MAYLEVDVPAQWLACENCGMAEYLSPPRLAKNSSIVHILTCASCHPTQNIADGPPFKVLVMERHRKGFRPLLYSVKADGITLSWCEVGRNAFQ